MCVVFSKTPPLTNLSSLIAASPSQQLIWDSSPDNAMMVLTKKQRMMAISAQIFHL